MDGYFNMNNINQLYNLIFHLRKEIFQEFKKTCEECKIDLREDEFYKKCLSDGFTFRQFIGNHPKISDVQYHEYTDRCRIIYNRYALKLFRMQRINIFKWKKELAEQYGMDFSKLDIENLATILYYDSSNLGYLWFNVIVLCATIICKDDEVVKMKNFLKTVHY
jgi:hypothetical protein